MLAWKFILTQAFISYSQHEWEKNQYVKNERQPNIFFLLFPKLDRRQETAYSDRIIYFYEILINFWWKIYTKFYRILDDSTQSWIVNDPLRGNADWRLWTIRVDLTVGNAINLHDFSILLQHFLFWGYYRT